jgi:hypothetical protein
MSPEDFYGCVKSGAIEVEVIGNGAYNKVFLTKAPVEISGLTAQWVVKIPLSDAEYYAFQVSRDESQFTFELLDEKNSDASLNSPIRSERKWQIINHDIPVHVFSGDAEHPIGWMTPYFGRMIPSDDLINLAVIDIYRRTGNIIADGCISTNFICHEGKAICIDMDLAIHRDSFSSSKYFNEQIATPSFDSFFCSAGETFRNLKTQETIKTLLYIEDYLSGSTIDYDLISPKMIEKLNVLRRALHPIHVNTLKFLNYIIENHLPEEFCQPYYLNRIVLTWTPEMSTFDLIRTLNDIKMPMPTEHSKYKQFSIFSMSSTVNYIPQFGFRSFFSGLRKRKVKAVPEIELGSVPEIELGSVAEATGEVSSELKV